MSLLSAATKALAQLEHLHGPNKCLTPGNCPTLDAITELAKEIAVANGGNPPQVRTGVTIIPPMGNVEAVESVDPHIAHQILRASSDTRGIAFMPGTRLCVECGTAIANNAASSKCADCAKGVA